MARTGLFNCDGKYTLAGGAYNCIGLKTLNVGACRRVRAATDVINN